LSKQYPKQRRQERPMQVLSKKGCVVSGVAAGQQGVQGTMVAQRGGCWKVDPKDTYKICVQFLCR
jgi:hypothetical protein